MNLMDSINRTAAALLTRKNLEKKKQLDLLSGEDALLCETESLTRRKLRALYPETWAERIAALPDGETKNRAAFVVWWDYFGGRQVSEAWPHLNEYLSRSVEDFEAPANLHTLPAAEQKEWKAKIDAWEKEQNWNLTLALCELGYTPHMAFARVKGEE
jgi:hypothetical protein